MANWRLAKSLTKLRDQINAAHPDRSKVSDGSIGDAAHAARKSEHNPDANGVVRAIDITHDPANGVDGKVLSRQLITDPRMLYVIFAGQIFKARTGKWEKYTGPNRHDHHVHISVVADPKAYDSTAKWNIERIEPLVPDTEQKPATGLDTTPAPQAVIEQPKEPPPKEINPETATSVPISKPSVWGQLKDITIPTGIGGVLTAIGTIFKTIPPWAWAVIIVAIIAAAVYLLSLRYQRAHERTLKAGDMASNPERNNIWFK